MCVFGSTTLVVLIVLGVVFWIGFSVLWRSLPLGGGTAEACSRCGHQNVPSAKFCAHCGIQLFSDREA